jgi:hypothetical protein
VLLGGAHQSLCAGTGANHIPSRHTFEAQRGHFANVVFIVDDQDLARHAELPPANIVRCGSGIVDGLDPGN